MSDDAWVPLRDLETFRRYKHATEGVIVIRRMESTTFHHPSCPHVREDAFLEKLGHGRHPYFWAPSADAATERWAAARACRHPSDPLAGGTGGAEARASYAPTTGPRTESSWSIDGPSAGCRAVRAEADFVLPYEPRTPEQQELRSELRTRMRRLACRDDEVLHASFFGTKPERADVENLLLYNVDDSARAFEQARGGLRFELSPRPMPDARRSTTYLYRPVKRGAGFALWDPAGSIASWQNVNLGHRVRREDVWFRLRRSAPARTAPVYDGLFALRMRVRVERGAETSAAALIKPLFDGAVAALQAHGDRTTTASVAERIAAATGRSPGAVAGLLSDPSTAALGVVPRLVHLRKVGFQFCPDDDRCVAGELLIDDRPASNTNIVACEVLPVRPR